MFNKAQFSTNLTALRKDRGLSMARLGEHLGVSDEAVRLMERGKRSPSVEILDALSDFFNVPLDFLCGRGVFANWGEYSAHSDDLRAVISESLGISEAALSLLDFSQFLSFIEAFFSHIEYHPAQNSFSLSPRLPLEVSRRILHGEGD